MIPLKLLPRCRAKRFLPCGGRTTSAASAWHQGFGASFFSTESTSPEILFQDHTHESVPDAVVSILTLNRPKANARGEQMLHELQKHLQRLQDPTSSSSYPRCLILTSSSTKVFSAGADLKERRAMTTDQAQAFVTDLRQTMQALHALPLPVLAAVEGAALGGGLELALTADVRLASRTATLGLPETSRAIIPGAGGTQRFPFGECFANRLIRHLRAAVEVLLDPRRQRLLLGFDRADEAGVVLVGELVRSVVNQSGLEGGSNVCWTKSVLDERVLGKTTMPRSLGPVF